jgi:hypothetical protein
MEHEPGCHPSGHAGKWAAWIALALVLYGMSIGPMAGFMGGYRVTGWQRRVIDTVYRPLVWGTGKASHTELLDRYEAWWENRMNNPKPNMIYFCNRPGSDRIYVRGTAKSWSMPITK